MIIAITVEKAVIAVEYSSSAPLVLIAGRNDLLSKMDNQFNFLHITNIFEFSNFYSKIK